ncbi:MAG: TonB-dependent receptor [Tistlia sp.]|uniref:TonB-dependent siderophore receptor n=1 Tax=Tistlia sp. TaxID=3057121 RepID=UPI0034A160BE
MSKRILAACTALAVGTAASAAGAETFKLEPVVVEGLHEHPSQSIRNDVGRSVNESRTNSYLDGSVIQNLSPVNAGDALRYNVPGFINQPGNGDRFGGGSKIRTFGDWGASQSIDGLPAIKLQGQEGGGYTNTLIPSIAIDRIGVLKGGRAVGYGDGTDGGVIETTIKSGRDYQDHQAFSFDTSSAREALIQGEAADSGESWDYYFAGSGLYGGYFGEPDTLEEQTIAGGIGKLGYNFSGSTRLELLGIYDRSDPEIIRNGVNEDISTQTVVGSATLDSKLSDINSLRVGYLYNDGGSEWAARNRDRSISNNVLFADHYLSTPVAPWLDYDGKLGAQYQRTTYERDNQWDNTFNDVSVLSQNVFTIDDNLVVSGGLRHTWFSNDIVLNGVEQADNLADDGVLSYEAGVAYSVLEQTRLRFSYATGYNRFFEKYGNFGTDALDPSGAGDEIVQSRTIEFGVNQGWSGGYLDVAWYNIVQDNVPRRNGGAIESVEVDQSGLEIELFASLTDDLTVSAGYMRVLDLESTRADGTKVNGNIFWDGQSTSVPENQFSIRLDYQVTDDVSLWGTTFYSTGYEAIDADDNVVERDGFTRVDLGASWSPEPDWALRVRVENLLDEKDFGTTVSGSTVNTDGKIGRVFWFGVDHTF